MSESKLQADFFQEISKRRRVNDLYRYVVAIPNEQRAGNRAAGYMVRLGMSPGFPDVYCFLARKGFNGFAIEFKTESGSQNSHQIKWQERLEKENNIYLVLREITIAVKLIEWYIS